MLNIGAIRMLYGDAIIMLLTLLVCHQAKAVSIRMEPKYECKDGWKRSGETCYKLDDTQRRFKDALNSCMGRPAIIKNKESNDVVKSLISKDTWIGLKTKNWETAWIRERYYTLPFHKDLDYNNLSPMTLRQSEFCYYMANDENGTWKSSECTEYMPIVCSKKADCGPDRWSSYCDEECFCAYGKCSRQLGKCPFGCRTGWTGPHCNLEQKLPTAEIFCLKTNQKYVALLAVDQQGLNLETISATSDSGQDSESTCTKNDFKGDLNGGSVFLNISVQDGIFTPNCPVTQISNDTYEWRFDLRQIAGVQSPFDIIYKFRCNFSEAVDLQANSSNPLESKLPAATVPTVTLNESLLPVELFLADALNGQQLTSVQLGQPVILKYTFTKDDRIATFSARKCTAQSSDGKQVKELTDNNGCTISTLIFDTENINSTSLWKGLSTKPFRMFAFDGEARVIFTCSFVHCPGYSYSCTKPCYESLSESRERAVLVARASVDLN